MNSEPLKNAILLIDKLPDVTSYQTVSQIKHLLGIKKVGHSGTIDRFATGLLIICTGRATKFTRYFLEDRKEYQGTVKIGVKTDTDDCSGDVIETKPIDGVSKDAVIKAVSGFIGPISQRPPHFSALKIKGKRASDIMRNGDSVDLPERFVTVYRMNVMDVDLESGRFRLDVECSKGTYIRSLARDIGETLGTGAHLESLRRIKSGIFSVRDAVTLDELADYLDGGNLKKEFHVHPKKALSDYSSLVIKNEAKRKVENGAAFQREDVVNMSHGDKKTYIIYDEDENVIAIANIDIEKWHIVFLNTFHNVAVEVF